MNKRFLFFVIFCLSFGCLFGQKNDWKVVSPNDFLKTLQKFQAFYDGLTSYTTELEYISYDSPQFQIVKDKTVGFYKRSGNFFYSYIMNIHSLNNDKYLIVVDEENQEIIISNPKKNIQELMAADISKYKLDDFVSIKEMDIDGDQKKYRFEMKVKSEVNSVEYTIKPSGWISQIVFYYEKDIVNENNQVEKVYPCLEMVFKNENLKYKPAISDFSEDNFINIKNGKMIPISKYSNYKIKDLRIQ